MMQLKNQKPLVIFLSALLLLAACQKDDGPAPEPVIESLNVAAAKPGDTIIIKGQNFSSTAANNTVKFNGATAVVVSASANELKVVVPNATSGVITVTVNGTTVEVGPIVLSEFVLYTIKGTYQVSGKYIIQLMAMDPANGIESAVSTVSESEDFSMANMLYFAATNEVMGISDHGKKLLKINVTTKQISSVTLTTSDFILFEELVTDNSGNLYAVKLDYTQQYPHQSLEQVNYNTGTTTTVKKLESGAFPQGVVYIPASNEIAMVTGVGERLLKVNLITKDTAGVQLTSSQDVQFKELVVDNQSNLYGYRHNYSAPNNDGQILKLDVSTGAQTLITTTGNIMFPDNFVFVPQRNEIITIWEETDLFRLNINTKATSTIKLTSSDNITYFELTGK